MEMDDDLVILADLQPVRLPTAILEQIDRLADERRRLLTSIASSRDGRRVRARLAEIDRELSRLWEARRRELSLPPRAGTGCEPERLAS